jgi:hypothetical protein
VDVEGTLLSFGYRRDELRTSAAALVVAIVLITAVGLLAPTTIERTDVAAPVNPLGTIGVTLGILAILIASLVVGYVIAARVIQHRWIWPIGPRVERPPRSNPNWPAFVATGVVLFGRRLLPNDGYPNLASGTYVIPGTTAEVIRVQAPVDFAFVLVSGMLAWVFAFALVIVAVTVWRSMSKASSVA